MDFGKLTLMRMMSVKMGYLSERQDILSHNIANIDTPGHKARDLKELDFKRMAAMQSNKLQMRITSENHANGFPKIPDDYRDVEEKNTFESSPMDNNVVLEEQMAKVAETQLEFQMVTNLYKKTTGLFKTAIGNRQ
jgi:flagellar basal-body rod protein FlgB